MTEPRPGVHLTLPAGHLNDPLGVTWHDGRYELFVQVNPGSPAWAPDCRWGQAHGTDLVRWRYAGTALEPAVGEGCWSGSVAVEDDGTPVIVYTGVDTAAPDIGRVVLARGTRGWDGWTADRNRPVVAGPPAELDLVHFRDPDVTADPAGGWRMVIGGGTRDRRALALLYRSPDLRRWDLAGVLAERPAARTDPLPTGAVWECPQLFALEGRWALLVSCWDEAPGSVAVAVGDLEGSRFTPAAWQPLDASGELYATTAFYDAAGRRCVLSWVPGTGGAGGPWAGLLSLPHVLSLEGDRLRVDPHPDIATLRAGAPVGWTAVAGGRALPVPAGTPLDVELDAVVRGSGRVELAVTAGDGELLRLDLDADGTRASRAGRPDAQLAATGATDRRTCRLVLDDGVAELFSAGAVAVLPLPLTGGAAQLELRVHGDAVVERFELHRLVAWYGENS